MKPENMFKGDKEGRRREEKGEGRRSRSEEAGGLTLTPVCPQQPNSPVVCSRTQPLAFSFVIPVPWRGPECHVLCNSGVRELCVSQTTACCHS